MVDVVDKQTRSRMMSGIRGKDTSPEILIRKILFRKGFRYRLHASELPGKPDLVFPRYCAVILINGCFWHGHECHLFRWPKTRNEFWKQKIQGNRRRDRDNLSKYKVLGWRVGIIWECALRGRYKLKQNGLADDIESWLISDKGYLELRGR